MPNKYYIDVKNNLRRVPKEKEAAFLKKYPGSREATPKELSDFENKRAEMQSLTQGESNIQNEQDSSMAKLPANNPLMDNQFGFDVPDYSEKFKPENYKIDLRQPDNTPTKIFSGDSPFASKTLEQTINDTRKNMPISPEAYFDMAIDRYKSEKDHIEQIKKDNTIPESVKQSLIKDYQENIRTSDDLTVDDKNLPPAARDWLERNKVERQVVQYMPSIMGGGSYTTTVRENTPEQIAFIKDYIANSAEGKRYAQAHKQFIDGLAGEADTLLQQVDDIRDTSKKNKEAYAKKHNISTWTLKGTNYRNDALLDKAANLLKNTKLLLSSNREGGGFWKGLHMTNEDLKELAVITESFYNDKVLNQVIDKYQKDPNSLSKEENIIIQAKYIADQISAGVDPGSWYNIGATTKQSLPFMRDFIMTAPIGGGAGSLVKGGASALASKTGLNFLLSRGAGPLASKLAKGAIDLSVRPAVQTMFSPSSYAMAFQEMQGQAVDRDDQGKVSFDNRKDFGHGVTSAFIENQSEVLGEVVLDKLFQRLRIPIPAFLKTNAAKRLSSATGIQGPITEYAEEKYADLANIVRGEQTIEGFFDPRQNLETFGAVAIMQIPFSAINSTGYGIGKIRDVQAKRAIRQTYDKSRSNLIEFFGEDAEIATESFNNLVDNSTEEELKNELQSVIEDERLDDKAKRAIVEYVTSYSAYSGINKAKQEQIQQAQEQVAQQVQENVNPDMDAIVMAKISGYDNPVQIWNGHIEFNEDGTINREKSSESVTIINKDGKKVPISINFVEELIENIPTEEATAQLSERAAEEITAEYENDEVREHQQGEVVRVSLDGNSFVVGQIEGRDEVTGDYILTIQTPNGVQQMPVQPRHIVNEDNLIGVENESLVNYINEQGEKVQGVVATNVDLYAQGLIGFENGDTVPVENVIGLVGNNEQISQSENVPMSDNMQATTQQNEGMASAEHSNVQGNEPRVFEIEEGLSAVENADGTYALDKQFAKSELKKADSLVKRLNEDYSDNGLVFETVQLPRKDASNPFEKPLWGVVARAQTETVGNPQPTVNDNVPTQPLERKQEKSVKKDTRPKRPTPFQKRLNAVEDNVSTVRDRILFGIASGAYKFRWKDKGVSMGLAREMGLSGSEAERKTRIGILRNDGYTPSTLAHHIWEETGMKLNDNDIRSEIIDVLSSISSRAQALEELERNAGITEEQYLQEQAEASEYEQQLKAEVEARYNEILDQLIEEDLVSLEDEAVSLGATSEQIADVITPTDYIDLIEQLKDGQQEGQTSNEGRNKKQIENVEGEGNNDQRTQRAVSERNKSTENTGDSRQAPSSAGDRINLSLEEQRVVDNATKEIDAEIAEAEKELTTQQKELSSARKRLGKAQAETQTNLFGNEQQDKLFDVPADLSKENTVDNILSPIQQQIDAAQTKLDNLTNSRDARIQEALDNHRKQGNLLDEIARVEAESEVENPHDVFLRKLTEVFPDGIRLYHRTTPENWQSIQKDGFIRMSEHNDGAEIGVHTVMEDPNQQRVGYDNSIILEITVPVESYNKLYPEEATYWQDFSESDVEFDNYDMIFDTYMNEHPDLIGGDIIYVDNIPLSMVTVYEPTVSDKIAQAEAETETNPTEAQKKAGNYKKGKVTIQGFGITIESVKGEERSGTDATGKKWSVTLNNTYGYFRKTEGKDKDHIDLFLGNNPESKQVFVIDQVNRDGSFDEHKVMFGFDSIEEAREAYLSNYEEGWQGLGNITQVDIETFRKWTESDTRRIKPFAEYKEIKESTPTYGSSNSVFTQNAYEEAKKKLRDKLNNMNSGFDPEMILLSTQVAGYHIEAGVRKLADLAARMIDDLGDGIRPYIKSAYESVRYYPGMADVAKEMDSLAYVNSFDIDNFGKEVDHSEINYNDIPLSDIINEIYDRVKSIINNDYNLLYRKGELNSIIINGRVSDAIQQLYRDKNKNKTFKAVAEKNQIDIVSRIRSLVKEEINKSTQITIENEQPTERNTETIESETRTIAETSDAIRNRAEDAKNSEQAAIIIEDISEAKEEIESLLASIDKKLENLRMTDKGYSTEGIAADYPINVLAKGEIKRDATKFVKAVAKMADLEFDTNRKGKREIVNVNIPPAGGDISFILWSKDNPDVGVYVSFSIDPGWINDRGGYEDYRVRMPKNSFDFMNRTLYRLTTKEDKYRGLSNQFVSPDITAKELAEKMVKDLNQYLGKKTEVNKVNSSKNEELSLKKVVKQSGLSQQLSIFDNVESNNNEYGTEPRILQTNSNRLPRTERAESVQGVERRQLSGRSSREQSETISKDDGVQRQSTRRGGSVLRRDADLLEPALVEYNIEDNDVESFNQSKKYDDNIAAIEVVIDALKNKRKVTPAEKEILSKYVGFGGLKDILYSPDNESSWTKTNSRYREQVRKIIELSKEVDSLTGKDTTLSDIRGSILNAHYTSSTVIRAMYDGLTKLGFKGGRVLEPSAGIGNFISYMPKHIQKNSSVTAVELDNLTGNILRLIHDEADTRISGIQDVAMPDNSQDLVISNIPFGNYRIYDKAFKGEKEKFLNRIHNYFFIKALDKAREGGIVALVTSKGVLDSPGNQDVREYINSHANFLGAVRLPNTTFKNVANTEVVTDIIFLQKNTQSKTNNEDFISIEKVEAVHKDGEIQEVGINNYFSKHPNNMLGEIEAGGLYSRDDYTLKDNGTSENLNKIIKDLLPKDIFKPVESGAGLQANDITRTILEVKQGNIFFNDGKLYRNQEGQAEEIKINEPQAKLESYISLRDTLMDLIYSEYIGKSDSEVESLRNDLNKQYDAFTKKYGKLEKSLPKIARQDADGYNVLSLENEGQKADIFSKRTIAPISTNNRAENIDEAIIMSLYENASIDIERIAELLNLPLDETIALSKGKLFQEPVKGQFVTREEYLSGNVKKKLKEAKQAVDSGYIEFTNNVTELEKVIPADIPAVHIEARMGSRWIPAEIYSQFAKELLNSDSASVTYSKSTDTYYDSGKVNTVEATNKYGTGRVNGMDIIIKALMISPPKVYDTHRENGKDVRVLNVQETSKANEKYEDVRNTFEDWVYRDLSRRELLSGIYNERYNTTVKRTYNGDHLNVPGINGVNLRPHQKDAVWMLLQNNGGIIDHLVGAGKTFVMIAAAQEMRRTGIAKKPMITALKSTIPQIVESYRSAYPMAKILAPTEKDFQKENRRKLFSKIANNEWDCIIMSHENYGKIPHELDIQRKFVQDEIDEVESERVQMELDGASKQAIKGLETRIKNLEARLEKLADLDKDNSITFQQMGIDHIIVDESQQFKNLSYVTKQRGVAGLGKPEGSKRAFNLFMGIRYLQEKYNADKGTTFLSGTPISNSMVEMYTLLKYLRPSKLQELNMTSFDAWATTFAVPTTDIEFTVTGDFKQKTRFREFINVPELSLMYTEIADIRTDDNLKLDKPKMKGGGYTVETIQMNDEQIEFGQALMEFARTKDGTVIGRGPLGEKEKTAAMLIATNLSSKMAIDMRLIDPSYSYDPNGKIAKAVENVYRIYNETNDFLGTQLIFSDLGTPKNTKSKSGLLRDYMEDELGANIDTLNEIFGDPNAAGFRFPSIKTVTNKIVEVLEMSEAEVADMIQEAENSVGGFNVYDEVKLRLIEKGVPENQIVFIHDYNTQRQKEKLFEQVNKGQIRIILGSTQKLGTGVNVQERASAIHHIDVPWVRHEVA